MSGTKAGAASAKPLPPGVLGLPWVGETVSLGLNNHQFYRDRIAKYGPIFKTRLFGVNFVVLSGPEAFTEFVTNPAFERGGVDPISVRQIFLRTLASVDGDDHRARKGVMLRGFDREALESYLPRMERTIGRYIARWEKLGDFTLLPELMLMAASLCGALYTADESDEAALELSTIVTWMRGAFTTLLPLNIPGTQFGRAVKGRNRLLELIEQAIDRHKRGSHDTLIARMMAAREPGSRVTDDNLRSDLLHILFASQGGYFSPLTLATMTLGQRPDLLEKAREEVLAKVPDGPLTMDRLDGLEFLERFSREVRRYFAMNSATFFATVKQPVDIMGHHIPAGWGAMAAIHITMRSPLVFDQPERFDPDRFLPEPLASRAPGSYVPHGSGPKTGHKCPAEDLVAVTIKVYMTLMLRRYHWDLPPQDLTLVNDLFPLPKSGVQLRFHPFSPKPQDQERKVGASLGR